MANYMSKFITEYGQAGVPIWYARGRTREGESERREWSDGEYSLWQYTEYYLDPRKEREKGESGVNNYPIITHWPGVFRDFIEFNLLIIKNYYRIFFLMPLLTLLSQ
jgi:hypothetical protein